MLCALNCQYFETHFKLKLLPQAQLGLYWGQNTWSISSVWLHTSLPFSSSTVKSSGPFSVASGERGKVKGREIGLDWTPGNLVLVSSRTADIVNLSHLFSLELYSRVLWRILPLWRLLTSTLLLIQAKNSSSFIFPYRSLISCGPFSMDSLS